MSVPNRKAKNTIKAGLLGVFFAALCCATPLGVFVLGGLGLSFLLPKLDIILLLLSLGCLMLVGYGLWKLHTSRV